METGPLSTASESPIEISIILPAFQEEQGIPPLLMQIGAVMAKMRRPYEILVVDDGSTDGTAARAREAGARVISHPYNIGNGAAVKTGIREARGRVIVMMDADGQHDPADIPRLLEQLGPHDMVVGARTRESETSLHRDLANRVYNWFASYICNRKIEDLTSGFRAIKAGCRPGFSLPAAEHVLLPDDAHPGHRPLRTKPEVCARENVAAGRPKQDQASPGRHPVFLHHPENRNPLFAHEGLPAGQRPDVPDGFGLRTCQDLLSGRGDTAPPPPC